MSAPSGLRRSSPSAVFIAVGQRPRSAHHLARRSLTQTVRIGGALDLDDLGAEVGEQPAEFAARDDHAEIQNPQTVERPVSTVAEPGVVGRSDRVALQAASSPPTGGAGRAKPSGCPSTTNAPTGTVTSTPGAIGRLGQRADRPEVLGRQGFCRAEHRGDRHAPRLARRDQLVHRLRGEQLGDQRVDLPGRAVPRGDRVELRILKLVRFPQPRPHSPPLPWRQQADPDVTVPTRRRSGRSAGFGVCHATARWNASGRRRPVPPIRTADRATAPPLRSGRSRCNRLCRNATGGSRRPAPPRPPVPRRWPRRCRSAAAPGVPSSALTGTAPSTSRRTPGRWRARTPAGRRRRSR